METAEAIIYWVQVYGGIGLAVAALFLLVGIDRVDEDAQGAYVFRPLLIPGVTLLWPLVLFRWWQIETGASPWIKRYRALRGGHGIAAILMCIAMGLALILGLSVRQDWPSEISPEQLSEADQ